jgi:Na+/proline symporter
VGISVIAYICIEDIGINNIHHSLKSEAPQLINLLFPAAIMFLFNNIFFGIGEIFHSNVWWSRAFAFKTQVGQKAFFVSGLLWLPVPLVAGFIALAAYQLNVFPPSPDMIGPLIVSKLFGQLGAVVIFVVVFAALASSLDSLLAATSDLITRDIYQGLFKPTCSNQHLLEVSQYTVVGLGIVCWVLCLPKMTSLVELLNFTGAFVASTIWPIVFGLYGTRLTGISAGIAMLLGTISGLIGYFTIGFYVAALISCVISLCVVLIGLLSSNQTFDWCLMQTARNINDS